MSSDEDNFYENRRDPKQIIGYVIVFALIAALGVYVLKRNDFSEKNKTGSEVVTATPDVQQQQVYDETYEEFISNVKKEIAYTLTVELPDEKYVSENKLFKEMMTIRNKCGRQSAVVASIGYRDKELCNFGSSCVVVEFSCDKDGEMFEYELRFSISARTGSNGKVDYYIPSLSVSQR